MEGYFAVQSSGKAEQSLLPNALGKHSVLGLNWLAFWSAGVSDKAFRPVPELGTGLVRNSLCHIRILPFHFHTAASGNEIFLEMPLRRRAISI